MLTLKERRFWTVYVKTGNGTEAVMSAYKCKDRATASAIAYENLRKPQFQGLLHSVMEDAGITDDYLTKKLKDGLEATKEIHPKNAPFIDIDPEGTGLEEQVVVPATVPDHVIRHKYLETALKWRGDITSKVEHSGEIKGEGTKIIIVRPGVEGSVKDAGTKNKAKTVPGRVSIQ